MSTVSFGGDYLPKRDYTWADGTFGWENNFLVSNWLEYVISGLSINIDESLLCNDFSDSSFLSTHSHLFSFIDSNIGVISASFLESLSYCDSYFSSSLLNSFLDNFTFRDKNCNTLGFSFNERTCLVCNHSSKSVFNNAYSELLSLNSNLLSRYVFPVFDRVCYCDSSLYDIAIVNTESYLFNENYDSVSFFDSRFYDNVSVYQAVSSSVGVLITDNILLDSEAFTGFDFVISNLAIFNKEMSFSDFDNMATRPFGYSNFREFKVGEYTYEKALIRVGVSSPDINFSTAIDKLSLHVDIPDTDDRGVVNIPAAETFVKFNKKYYNPPEDVSLAIKGGTTNSFLVPKLISVTNLGFTVVIHDSSGNIASGVISWASKGY